MNDYAMGALLEPTRARVRIQIRTEAGLRDDIIIVQRYQIVVSDGTHVLVYDDSNGNRGRRVLSSGTYFETKIMG